MVTKINNITRVPYLGKNYSEEEIEQAIDNFIANETIKGFERDANLLDFFPLVQNVIRTKEDEENRSLTKSEKEVYRRLLLLEGDPPEAVDTEAIVWELGARVPGRFDQGPAGKGRIAEVMPHLRESVVHPEIPNQKLLTMGKFYGNWIDFKIIARDSKQALRRLLWFEEAMDSFHWYFRFFGFRAIEVGVGNKEKIKIDNLDLIQYPITYFVRSEDVFHITTQDLKKLIITTNVSKS